MNAVILGGNGFIGSHVRDIARFYSPPSVGYDLRRLDDANRAVASRRTVIHLAAKTGGIQYSRAHPASQYFDCATINLNVFRACETQHVEHIIALGNLLAYPKDAPSPLREDALFRGRIAETHLGIGMSKLDLIAMGEMYHREYGINVTILLAANAYGPRDRFDPETSHVIPATIRKCLSGEPVVMWGDGSPIRDFLYVEDLAAAIVAATALRGFNVLNIGSGCGYKIEYVANKIADLCGYKGEIAWDLSKIGGDPHRIADTAHADQLLPWRPKVALHEGLERTIEWYRVTR